MTAHMADTVEEIVKAAGGVLVNYRRGALDANGAAIHEHGTCRMGADPKRSARVEDIATLDAERRVCGCVVAAPSQQVRGTAGQGRRGVAVVGGPGHPGRGVALGDRREVDRRVAVRAFGLIRQAAVDGSVVSRRASDRHADADGADANSAGTLPWTATRLAVERQHKV